MQSEIILIPNKKQTIFAKIILANLSLLLSGISIKLHKYTIFMVTLPVQHIPYCAARVSKSAFVKEAFVKHRNYTTKPPLTDKT